jgi:hypothetical protein
MQHVTHELKETEKLDVVKSSLESIEASRSYTPEQVHAITLHIPAGSEHLFRKHLNTCSGII